MTVADIERVCLERALQSYPARNERVAMRAALGDASALCDAVASKIRHKNSRNGRLTKEGEALMAVATRVADVLWKYHEKITVPEHHAVAPVATDVLAKRRRGK